MCSIREVNIEYRLPLDEAAELPARGRLTGHDLVPRESTLEATFRPDQPPVSETICGAQVQSSCSEFLKWGGAVAADVAGVDGALGLEEEC